MTETDTPRYNEILKHLDSVEERIDDMADALRGPADVAKRMNTTTDAFAAMVLLSRKVRLYHRCPKGNL